MSSEFRWKVFDQIEKNHESWNQESWRCKTGMCYAGWTIEMSPEAEWVLPLDEAYDEDGYPKFNAFDVRLGNEVLEVRVAAARLLGIHETDHIGPLFGAANTLDAIKAVLTRLDENPDVSWEELYEVRDEAMGLR